MQNSLVKIYTVGNVISLNKKMGDETMKSVNKLLAKASEQLSKVKVDAANPLTHEDAAMLKELSEQIQHLKYSLVIKMYLSSVSGIKIAEILGITGARVSQIITGYHKRKKIQSRE